jgi:hypothetical protein
LDKVYGIYKGNHKKSKEDNTPSKSNEHNVNLITQKDLAKELGIGCTTLCYR